MLTCAWGVTQNGWVICYAWSLFIYGIGVGKLKHSALHWRHQSLLSKADQLTLLRW
ncbi:hypothetical protein ASPTUDRAFT_47571, partial [Aspergillus tubingensis CBS 134.48]